MKLKKLNKALVAAGLVAGAAVSMPSQAVVMSDDGTGEVLIYPFYTVQGPAGAPRATLFTITNTKDEYKAVKVRFHEAHNSRDALDFNLYLSPFDVWTGAVARSGDVSVLTTTDNSCTIPTLQPINAFSTDAFGQTGNNDGGNQSGLRTNEGYLEVIEMGVIDPLQVMNPSLTPDDDDGSAIDTFGEAIKHVDGTPGSCANLQQSYAGGGIWDLADFDNTHNAISQPSGGLMGSALIVQAATGTVAGYDATALKHFYDVSPIAAETINGYSALRADTIEAVGVTTTNRAFDDVHSFKDLNPNTANARSIQTYPNLAMAYPQISTHVDADATNGTTGALAAVVHPWSTNELVSTGVTPLKDNELIAAIEDLEIAADAIACGGTDGIASTPDDTGICANARPVSAVLAKNSLINEYVLDQDAASGIDFRTDIVVTFPTKWYFTDNGLYTPASGSGDDAVAESITAGVEDVELAPFSSQFVSVGNGRGNACEQFSISDVDQFSDNDHGNIFDREEGVVVAESTPSTGLVPSPAINVEAADPTSNFICHEANVLSLNDGDILTSRIANGLDATVGNSAEGTNSFNIDFPAGFTSGWFEMKFDTNGKHVMTDTAGDDVTGLPAVGFVVEGLVAGSNAFDGNFTAALPHKTR